MKKLLLVLALGALATGASAAYKDGTYEGQGQGKEGILNVSVTVKGGKIADVKLVKHGDTEMIIGGAFPEIAKEIVAKNSADVADVAGATLSSKGIKAAVADALKKAM